MFLFVSPTYSNTNTTIFLHNSPCTDTCRPATGNMVGYASRRGCREQDEYYRLKAELLRACPRLPSSEDITSLIRYIPREARLHESLARHGEVSAVLDVLEQRSWSLATLSPLLYRLAEVLQVDAALMRRLASFRQQCSSPRTPPGDASLASRAGRPFGPSPGSHLPNTSRYGISSPAIPQSPNLSMCVQPPLSPRGNVSYQATPVGAAATVHHQTLQTAAAAPAREPELYRRVMIKLSSLVTRSQLKDLACLLRMSPVEVDDWCRRSDSVREAARLVLSAFFQRGELHVVEEDAMKTLIYGLRSGEMNRTANIVADMVRWG